MFLLKLNCKRFISPFYELDGHGFECPLLRSGTHTAGTLKSYPHPRLRDFSRLKKTPKTRRRTKNSLAAGIVGWG